MRVIISEFMDPAAVASLAARFDTACDEDLSEHRDQLKRLIADADALIVRNKTQVDGDLLAAAPQLKVVGRLGVGLDNIDVLTCKSRGIEIIPATGANALAVAEYVIAAALILLRGAYSSTSAVAAGKWPRPALANGRELAGKTLGMVGFGQIGQLTGRLARAVGVKVIGFDAMIPAEHPMWAAERTTARKFDEVLHEADVISIHVPLTPATRGLIDADRLALMKSDAVLINTSRGEIVNEAALAAALKSGKLGGAALDVFEHEPLAAGSALAGCPHLLLTPHIAGVTRESNVRVSSMIAEKVGAALERYRSKA
ncbi:MAG TPA: hydroxyacid dehydrogenase [Casimicrobiaceae bacterium]|nr:hydroxyacid dehydrogenase [Casimicrobiaceae bacterium]